MSEQDMYKIRKLAEEHTMAPRPDAWRKLNGKLKAKRTKRRMLAYRNISIAAILISILSVTVVFSIYLGKHNPKMFSSNEQYRPVIMEELIDIENEPFYDVKYIDELHIAYTKIGF